MKPIQLLLALCLAPLSLCAEYLDEATISIQPITSSAQAQTPITLATIKYNPSTLSASLESYETPFFSQHTPSQRLRVGIYDAATGTWRSATSVTSIESFAKGYRPTIVLSLDAQGAVLGASVKSSVIDAGQTRDFGPKVVVRGVARGKGPVLNKPVVLSESGKLEEPVVEKTMLQKYWWVLLGGVMLLMTTGGE